MSNYLLLRCILRYIVVSYGDVVISVVMVTLLRLLKMLY